MTAALGGIVGGITALLGVLVGKYLDTRSEVRKWERDRRVQTYEKLAGSYYQVRESIRALAFLDPQSDDEARAAAERVLDVGAEWNRDVVSVWLYGSELVTDELNRLDKEVNQLFTTIRTRNSQVPWEEWRRTREPAEVALERFIGAVRSELKRPTALVRVRAELPPPTLDRDK